MTTRSRSSRRAAREGAAAVEFAMVGGAFVLLLLTVLQFSLLLLSRTVMHNVLADLATGEAAPALMTADRSATVDYICGRLVLSPDCRNQIRLEATELTSANVKTISSRFVTGKASTLMIARAEAPIVVFVPLFPSMTVRGKAVYLRP